MLEHHLTSITFVDVETTGLESGWHVAWEAAYGILIHNGHGGFTGHVASAMLPVDKDDRERADPVALDVGGFYARWEKPSDEDVALTRDDIMDSVEGQKLAGCNVGFDAGFLHHFLMESERYPMNGQPWDYHLVEFESLMAGWLTVTLSGSMDGLPRVNCGDMRWKSIDMYKAISEVTGSEMPSFQTHTAAGDVGMMLWAAGVMLGDLAPVINGVAS